VKVLLFLVAFSITTWAAAPTVSYQMIGGVPANNLCDNGEDFLTVDPVKTCVQWTHIPEKNHGEIIEPGDWRCDKYQLRHMSISKEINVCVAFVSNEQFVGCTKWEKGVQGNKVIGEKVTEHGEASHVEYFDYVIPACPVEG
jgi:hypothetical protein